MCKRDSDTQASAAPSAESPRALLPHQLSAVVHGSADGLLVVDQHNVICFANAAAAAWLGQRPDALIGQVFAYPVPDHGRSEAAIPQANGDPAILELNCTEIVWEAAPLRLAAVRDITEHKRHATELQQQIDSLSQSRELLLERAKELALLNYRLQASERQMFELMGSKDKLFHVISHDLKSPFTNILGYCEILEDELDELTMPEVREHLVQIRKAAQSTYDLVEQLLQWSSIQSGHVDFEPQRVALDDLVEHSLALLRGNAEAKGIGIRNEANAEHIVYADADLMALVLRNLLTNAIKFTTAGGQVTVRTAQAEDTVQVTVMDTGVGIPPEGLAKLFRADTHYTTRGTHHERGTGLGLLLCKEVIERHGGQIWIESTVGTGTTARFTLPVAPPLGADGLLPED